MAIAPGTVVEVEIERLGSRGDGIARAAGVPVYVPFALPGERLAVRLDGRRGDGYAAGVVARHLAMPRAAPACIHFGRCGGCQLQHLDAAAYAAWQRAEIIDALARRGLEGVEVAAPAITPPGTRRRARFAFAREGRALRLGFRERTRHRLVDLGACPVVTPAIEALLAPLRDLLGRLPAAGRAGEVMVTEADTGLDVLLITARPPALADREALAAFAAGHDLARLCWQAPAGTPEPVVAHRPVRVDFDGVAVELPPGAFLQATAFAEAAIREAVGAAIGEAAAVVDLFAGCGTFALPLAASGRRVRAVEVDPAMLAALAGAARRAGLGARITPEARDLEARPLEAGALEGVAAVVLDPPRAGARAQAEALAGTRVGRVAMVSCNPATFARDARILVAGGHRLLRVQPVDPFLWSSRIELVGAFARA